MESRLDAQVACIEDIANALYRAIPEKLPHLPLHKIQVYTPPKRPAVGVEFEFVRQEWFEVPDEAELMSILTVARSVSRQVFVNCPLEIQWLRPPLHRYPGFVIWVDPAAETVYPRIVYGGRVRLHLVREGAPA